MAKIGFKAMVCKPDWSIIQWRISAFKQWLLIILQKDSRVKHLSWGVCRRHPFDGRKWWWDYLSQGTFGFHFQNQRFGRSTLLSWDGDISNQGWLGLNTKENLPENSLLSLELRMLLLWPVLWKAPTNWQQIKEIFLIIQLCIGK